jgi:hypothetical protein
MITELLRKTRVPLTGTLTAVLLLLLSGCDSFPRDIAGTMDHVTNSGILHVGIVADPPVEADEKALAGKIAESTGVITDFESGSAEVLLHRLEEGELDLVVGRFAGASPWKKRVAFTQARATPGEAGKHEPVLRAAVRHGENRWLLFVGKTLHEEL